MPIRKYIPGPAFSPEEIAMMTNAFEKIQVVLNMKGADDPLAEIIAKKIVSLASQRIFDANEIKRRVVADMP